MKKHHTDTHYSHHGHAHPKFAKGGAIHGSSHESHSGHIYTTHDEAHDGEHHTEYHYSSHHQAHPKGK